MKKPTQEDHYKEESRLWEYQINVFSSQKQQVFSPPAKKAVISAWFISRRSNPVWSEVTPVIRKPETLRWGDNSPIGDVGTRQLTSELVINKHLGRLQQGCWPLTILTQSPVKFAPIKLHIYRNVQHNSRSRVQICSQIRLVCPVTVLTGLY